MRDADRLPEIQARWAHIPTDEQPRIAVTNSSRGGSLLNALGYARTDVPWLVAEVRTLRAQLATAERQLSQLDDALDDFIATPDGRAA